MVTPGKTTFIKNLFASYANDPDLKVNDASASTAARTFVESPEKLMTEVTVEDKKNLLVFHYRIQDTPGVVHLPSLQPWLRPCVCPGNLTPPVHLPRGANRCTSLEFHRSFLSSPPPSPRAYKGVWVGRGEACEGMR